MNILFLRSVDRGAAKDHFSVRINTTYVQRVLVHLSGDRDYCSACQQKCIHCRDNYELGFSKNIVGVLEFDSVLPAILEDPECYLPDDVPDHDILIPVAVNEEIIISFLKRFPIAKGVIIPIEQSDWISPNAIVQITDICTKHAIEVSFPKPFCSFDPPEGSG